MNTFKTLIAIKSADPALDIGPLKILTQNNVLAYSRPVSTSFFFYPTYVILVNFDNKSTTVDFGGEFTGDEPNFGYVVLSTLVLQSEFQYGLVLVFIIFISD